MTTKASLIDLNGNEMILDADGDTKIDAATDDEIHFTVAGSETVYMGVTSYNASDRIVLTNTGGNASATIVGSTSGESSIFMADGTSGDASYRGYVQYQHTNDNMNIGTAGSEAMRIDSSGNVGTAARLSVGTTTVGGGNTKIVATGGTDNYLQLVSNTGSGGVSLGNAGSVFLLYTHTGALGSESFSERMRIDASGNVLLATTSAQESTTHLLTVGAYGRNGNGIYVGGYSSNDMITLSTQYDQTYGMKYIRGGSVKGYVSISSVGAAHVNSGSDERLKENIQTWEEDVSSKFKNIKPKTFNFIDDEDKKTVKGFIAQDMIDKFPEAYPYNEKQERYFYSAENMVVYLMKAIQEQQEQIESLQQEIEVLKNGN